MSVEDVSAVQCRILPWLLSLSLPEPTVAGCIAPSSAAIYQGLRCCNRHQSQFTVIISATATYLCLLCIILINIVSHWSFYPSVSVCCTVLSATISSAAGGSFSVSFIMPLPYPRTSICISQLLLISIFSPLSTFHSLPSDAIFRYLRGLLSMLFDVCSS